MKYGFISLSLLSLITVGCGSIPQIVPDTGLETVLEIDRRPGNVLSMDGTTLATIHPFAHTHDVRVIEVTDTDSYRPWPNKAIQAGDGTITDATFDSPFGIVSDHQGGVWIVDAGFNNGQVRVWHFDLDSGDLIASYNVDPKFATKGSFVQDIAVDATHQWVFLADIAPPGIIAMNLQSGEQRRFSSNAMSPERSGSIIINGNTVMNGDKPNLVGINPITYHAESDSIFFGAMSGRNWYQIPAEGFREKLSDAELESSIRRVGPKPISDGADTALDGTHYITNLNHNGIDVLSSDGKLLPLVRDDRLNWPDNIRISDDGYGYIVANQLHLAPALNDGKEEGTRPFYIYRIKTNND